MQRTNIAMTVRRFIEETYLLGQADTPDDHESFLDGGLLDSTGVLQLVAFIEETYGFTVADEEVTPDNLDSIEKVATYVGRRLTLQHEQQPKMAVGGEP